MRPPRTPLVLALAVACWLPAALVWWSFILPLDTEVFEVQGQSPAALLELCAPVLVLLAPGAVIYLGLVREAPIWHALVAGLVPLVVVGGLGFAVRGRRADERRAIAEFNWYASRFPQGRLGGAATVHEHDASRVTACAREVRSKARATRGDTLFCLEVDTDRPEREGVTGGFRHVAHGVPTYLDEPFDCFGRSERCFHDVFD